MLKRRNAYDETLEKILNFLIVLVYRIDILPEKLLVGFLFVMLFLRVLIKKKLGALIDDADRKFEVSLHSVSLYFCSVLLVHIASGRYFQLNWMIFVAGAIGLGTAIVFKKEKASMRILGKKFKEVKSAFEAQVFLETICLHYTKSQKGDLRSTIILEGVNERLQREAEQGYSDSIPLNIDNYLPHDAKLYQIKQTEALLEYMNYLYFKSRKK